MSDPCVGFTFYYCLVEMKDGCEVPMNGTIRGERRTLFGRIEGDQMVFEFRNDHDLPVKIVCAEVQQLSHDVQRDNLEVMSPAYIFYPGEILTMRMGIV